MGYPNWTYTPDAVVETHIVQLTPDQRSIEIIATIVTGNVEPGMILLVPLNERLDLSVRIRNVTPTLTNQVRIIADGDSDPDFIVALQFQDEILGVVKSGKDNQPT